MKHKLESRFQGEISITSDMQMSEEESERSVAESEEDLKEPLDECERRE